MVLALCRGVSFEAAAGARAGWLDKTQRAADLLGRPFFWPMRIEVAARPQGKTELWRADDGSAAATSGTADGDCVC